MRRLALALIAVILWRLLGISVILACLLLAAAIT